MGWCKQNEERGMNPKVVLNCDERLQNRGKGMIYWKCFRMVIIFLPVVFRKGKLPSTKFLKQRKDVNLRTAIAYDRHLWNPGSVKIKLVRSDRSVGIDANAVNAENTDRTWKMRVDTRQITESECDMAHFSGRTGDRAICKSVREDEGHDDDIAKKGHCVGVSFFNCCRV